MDGVDRILNLAPLAGFAHPIKQVERTDPDAHKRQEPEDERDKGDVLELHVAVEETTPAIEPPNQSVESDLGLDLAV